MSEKCIAPCSRQRTQNAFFNKERYFLRYWLHSRDKLYQAFPLRFRILQAIKNWTVGRPGNKAMKKRGLVFIVLEFWVLLLYIMNCDCTYCRYKSTSHWQQKSWQELLECQSCLQQRGEIRVYQHAGTLAKGILLCAWHVKFKECLQFVVEKLLD